MQLIIPILLLFVAVCALIGWGLFKLYTRTKSIFMSVAIGFIAYMIVFLLFVGIVSFYSM